MPVLGRRLVARRVAGRRVGRPIELQSTPRILEIEDGLWRGPAPGSDGYTELARHGVTTVVDLRSEIDSDRVRRRAEEAGIEFVWVPINNARSPQPSDSERFRASRQRSQGTTYVHCEAGEGRTGAIVGTYQVARGRALDQAVADALAVGPLSFSQLVYVALRGRSGRVPTAIEWAVDRPTELVFALQGGDPGPA